MNKFLGWTIAILVLVTITAAFAPLGIGLAAFIWWLFATVRKEAHEKGRKRQREERQRIVRGETSKELAKVEAKKDAIRKTIPLPDFSAPWEPADEEWDNAQFDEYKLKQADALRAAGYNPNCYGY